MAATTPLNLILQARDWEILIGIIANSADSDISELQYNLSTYYRTQATKPQGTDSITMVITEDLAVRLTVYLYGNTVFNITKDLGTNSFNRIMTAIRAVNNAADNYISSQLAINDNNYSIASTNIRKNGRRIILMKQYDNN